MNIICKHCGNSTYDIVDKGTHMGAYCKNCGKWIKWVSKSECKKGGIPVSTAQTYGAQVTAINSSTTNIPEPVLGTEKAKLICSEGMLMLQIDGKYYKLYEAQDMTERFRVVLKQGNAKTELLPGDQLNIFIM